MKLNTKLGYILLSLIGVSCYDEVQYADTPQIAFKGLSFLDASSGTDSLRLTFEFQDGDRDLGFSSDLVLPSHDLLVDSEPKIITANNLDQIVPPVYLAPLYLETFEPLSLSDGVISGAFGGDTYPAILDSARIFEDPIVLECPNIINQSLDLIDTTGGIAIYALDRNFFYRRLFIQPPSSLAFEIPALERVSFYNIYITFEEQDINGDYNEIDFAAKFQNEDCGLGNFNGRIPIFGDGEGESGTITYNMISRGFRVAFQDNNIRLKFSVRDRAGNISNEETVDFMLSEITQ